MQIPDGQNKIDQEIVQAKRQLEKFSLQFDQFLKDKTLPLNKTQGQLVAESDYVQRLLMAAYELNRLNPPEGLFGLFALLLREGFEIRDRSNALEYELKTLRQDINKLKNQINDSSRKTSG